MPRTSQAESNLKPDSRGRLTTDQVMRITGKTREALFTWVRKGYLPPPQTEKVPEGRGRRATWYMGVLRTIEQLDALAARGVPLRVAHQQIMLEGGYASSLRYDEVYEVGQKWRAPGSGGALAARLHLPGEASLSECFTYSINRMASLVGLDDRARERVDWAAGEYLVGALMNFIMGFDPVMVVAPDGLMVAPREALPQLYKRRHREQADLDDWADLLVPDFEPPRPYEQDAGQRWFPAFAVLDLGPLMASLWRQWGHPVGKAFGMPAMQYEYAPVVWHQAEGRWFENDATLDTWGRRPLVFILDVKPQTARPVTANVDSHGETMLVSRTKTIDDPLVRGWQRGAPDRRTDAERAADLERDERLIGILKQARPNAAGGAKARKVKR